jgi:hypothetical protein
VALDSRDSSAHQLNFMTTDLGSFTANNSVQPGGIHAKPFQTTMGDGAVTGEEVRFDVSFTDPFSLARGHYFFVPQVALDSSNNFLWLSAPKPIVDPGTPFPAGFTDLQSWTRDANLDPDWLRAPTSWAPIPLLPLRRSMLRFRFPAWCRSLARSQSWGPDSSAWVWCVGQSRGDSARYAP